MNALAEEITNNLKIQASENYKGIELQNKNSKYISFDLKFTHLYLLVRRAFSTLTLMNYVLFFIFRFFFPVFMFAGYLFGEINTIFNLDIIQDAIATEEDIFQPTSTFFNYFIHFKNISPELFNLRLLE